MDAAVVDDIKRIPAMTPSEVHEYLFRIGKAWSGKGVAMELGAWLGASSVSLLHGLVQVGYDYPFWAFDRWWVDKEQVSKARLQGVGLTRGENSVNIYLNNVNPIYDDIRAVRGEIPGSLTSFTPAPIEILIFDAPKKNPVFIDAMRYLLPYCIPGVTVIGLLDYYMYKNADKKRQEKLEAPVRFMERFVDNFELIKDWKGYCSCAFFKYKKKIKQGELDNY